MADFLRQCMSDLQTDDAEAFKETFCARCKNPDCDRASWSVDRFSNRMATQAERLLNPPRQVTQAAGSRYEKLQDFVDMTKEALRLEISSQRGDWSVPGEEPPAPRAFLATATPEPAPSKPATPAVIPTAKNTPPPPPEGVVVGSGPVPVSPRNTPIPQDNWDPKPAVRVVKPGARIKLGG